MAVTDLADGRVDDAVSRLIDVATAGSERSVDPARITAAAQWAGECHAGRMRRSGDAAVSHSLAVGHLVAEWGMDETSIVAGIIHDVVEDTDAELADVEERFGPEVSIVVEGLTALDGLRLGSVAGGADSEGATRHKLLLQLASDIRVLVVKLADRLHNMRTISALESSRAAAVAEETREVYVSLARRLGLAPIAAELEDHCFAVLEPDRRAELERLVEARLGATEQWARSVVADVELSLSLVDLDADVTWRRKSLWSIEKKIQAKGVELDDVYDLIGVRVIVADTNACYTAFAQVHETFEPVPDRFKDYISTPRTSLYQSIHTAVLDDEGRPIEVQIRSRAMHHRAEWGVAAHWRYKNVGGGEDDASAALSALRTESPIVDVPDTPDEVLERLRAELTDDNVICFTPRGDIVALPPGSTPVDFAYAVHTQVGHSVDGARVDGRQVQLSTPLATGSTVELTTGRKDGPNADWLTFVGSNRAQSQIRRALNLDRDDADSAELDPEPPRRTVLRRPRRKKRRTTPKGEVLVDGEGGFVTRMAKCCSPVVGDELIGWPSGVRRRAIVVHSATCETARADIDSKAAMNLTWSSTTGAAVALISVEATNRPGLLGDQTNAISLAGGEIDGMKPELTRGIALSKFEIIVEDASVVGRIMSALEAVDGVHSVRRSH